MDASDHSHDCAPLAALLYDTGSVPGIDELIGAAAGSGEFTITHVPPTGEGWAEVLRDGLTFDLRGLSGGDRLPAPEVNLTLGVDGANLKDICAIEICPGPHLAGAQRLLPVIRVAAALAIALSKIGQPRGICWIPARNAVDPELFKRAVNPWFEGGPFPALALVSLHRQPDGAIASEGLKFMIGQEFVVSSDGAKSIEYIGRVALRLVDWLVVNGPIVKATEAILAGTGAVFVEVPDSDRIVARCI